MQAVSAKACLLKKTLPEQEHAFCLLTVLILVSFFFPILQWRKKQIKKSHMYSVV